LIGKSYANRQMEAYAVQDQGNLILELAGKRREIALRA